MASNGQFPVIYAASANIRVMIDLSSYGKKFDEVQEWFGQRVLQDCLPKVPIRSGSLRQRSYVAEGGKAVVFPGPYASFLYKGKVMVDPETGSPWARKGVKKVSTDRPLKYSDPGATDHWFDATKAEFGQQWISELNRMIGRR